MTKDRLADLKAAQSDEDESDTDEFALNMEPRDGFMDEFFAEVEELREMVETVKNDIEQVKKTQSAIISAPQTDEKMQQQLEDIMAVMKETLNQIRQRLKAIEQSIDQAEQISDSSPADVRIRKTQHATLSRKFVEVMTEYNRTQTDYRERCKERIQRQLEIIGKTTTDEELEEILEQGSSAVFIFTQGIVITDEQQARQTLAEIEARHADIIKLENSIRELYDMFAEMAVLVESQGEMIDNIEYQVSLVNEYIDRAKGRIRSGCGGGGEYKRRKKKIMIMICLLVTSVILVSTVAGYLGL